MSVAYASTGDEADLQPLIMTARRIIGRSQRPGGAGALSLRASDQAGKSRSTALRQCSSAAWM